MKRWIKGQRGSFFNSLYEIAKKDKNVILVTSDTGAICHDEFRKEMPDQYINVCIAEQNMIGLAAGLAMAGKVVYVYAITPFATMRCYEQIRVDLCCMDLPVTIVGIGAGFDYSTLGPTHHGTEDISLMRSLPGMKIYSPSDSLMAGMLAKVSYKEKGPKYIRLDRTGFPLLYKNQGSIDFSKGFSVLTKGEDLCIIATGRMVYNALQVAQKLSSSSIKTKVVDLFKIKPLNEKMLWNLIRKTGHVVTLEEHFITGGIGSVIAEKMAAEKNAPRFKAIGIPDEFCRRYGTRDYLQCLNGLDTDSVAKSIRKWISA